MSSQKPKLSVCIPVFNVDWGIGKVIESILRQSFEDFELIVIDNQSDDKTVDVVKGFRDPRIKLIINDTNIGPSRNANKCVCVPQGEFVIV